MALDFFSFVPDFSFFSCEAAFEDGFYADGNLKSGFELLIIMSSPSKEEESSLLLLLLTELSFILSFSSKLSSSVTFFDASAFGALAENFAAN